MELAKFLSRFELKKLEPGIDIRKDVDEVVVYLMEQENMIELLKGIREALNEKIKELEERLEGIKLEIAQRLDGKVQGMVFGLGVRRMEKLVQVKEEIPEGMLVKRFKVEVQAEDENELEELKGMIGERFKYKVKEVVDREASVERLIEEGYMKRVVMKGLVIYGGVKKRNQNQREGEENV